MSTENQVEKVQETTVSEKIESNYPELIKELLSQITQFKPTLNLDAQVKVYSNDEEFKKIRKQKKQKKITELNTDVSKDVLLNIQAEVEKLIKECKINNVDSWKNEKQIADLNSDKEKKISENNKLRQQVKVLEKLKQDLDSKFHEKHDEYSKALENEKQLKQNLVNSFQDEIKVIQDTVEAKCQLRAQKHSENEHLKEKLKEVQQHIEKRDSIFSTELDKHDTDRKERETKIDTQIASIESNMGVPDDAETQISKHKEEEELIDSHLNPYLTKTQEFQQVIELTNKQFDPYKNEMQRLHGEKQRLESDSIKLQRKCEKSDLYIVEMVEEHLKLQEELDKQHEQYNVLQNLLATLQGQLL